MAGDWRNLGYPPDQGRRRWCSICQIWKSVDDFYLSQRKYKGQLRKSYRARWCKPCHTQYVLSNRNPDHNREAHLRRLYGLTPAQYEEKLKAQGGVCAICGSDDPGRKSEFFPIDHDHVCCPGPRSCGKCIRKLLCFGCNTGLGRFMDDPDLLERAAAYLRQHQSFSEAPVRVPGLSDDLEPPLRPAQARTGPARPTSR